MSVSLVAAAIAKAALAAAISAGTGGYTVQPGDTLSSIAARTGTTWRALCTSDGIANCNRIYPGQRIGVGGGYYQARHAKAYYPRHAHYHQPRHAYGGGTYEQCVIQRESGGNPRAVNSSSGAGGLYQFLPSTWHSLGYSGSAANAPVWLQRQAFQRLHAQMGNSPWAADGC